MATPDTPVTGEVDTVTPDLACHRAVAASLLPRIVPASSKLHSEAH